MGGRHGLSLPFWEEKTEVPKSLVPGQGHQSVSGLPISWTAFHQTPNPHPQISAVWDRGSVCGQSGVGGADI